MAVIGIFYNKKPRLLYLGCSVGFHGFHPGYEQSNLYIVRNVFFLLMYNLSKLMASTIAAYCKRIVNYNTVWVTWPWLP